MKFVLRNVIVLVCATLFSGALFGKGLTLESKDMIGQMSNNQVFNGFGCTGKNISPELKWKNAPKGTKSFAITMYDPDAPTGSGWWHWVVFDISKGTKKISRDASKTNKFSKGTIQSVTDFGKSGFGGACPPKGSTPHAYITTVHALDVDKLGLDAKASPALVGFKLNFHTIEKSSIVTYYNR